jgi:hypothetical protein
MVTKWSIVLPPPIAWVVQLAIASAALVSTLHRCSMESTDRPGKKGLEKEPRPFFSWSIPLLPTRIDLSQMQPGGA